MSDHPADCGCKAVKAPDGWTPPVDLEVPAYAFGIVVETEGEKVMLKQVVSVLGLEFVVVSGLDPETARRYSQTLLDGATLAEKNIEEKKLAEKNSDVPG